MKKQSMYKGEIRRLVSAKIAEHVRGFPGGSVVRNLPANIGDPASIPGLGRVPSRRKWQSIPVFLPGKSHGWRSLAGYSPGGHKRVGHDLATKEQQQPSKSGLRLSTFYLSLGRSWWWWRGLLKCQWGGAWDRWGQGAVSDIVHFTVSHQIAGNGSSAMSPGLEMYPGFLSFPGYHHWECLTCPDLVISLKRI